MFVTELVLVLSSTIPAAFAARPHTIAQLRQNDLTSVARRVPKRGSLRIERVPFEGREVALELERFDAFAAGARIVIRGQQGDTTLEAPDNAYYRGTVEGDPAAVAVFSARAKGGGRGLIVKNGVSWVIGDDPAGGRGVSTRPVDLKREFSGRTFTCATDGALSPPGQNQTSPVPSARTLTARDAGSVDYTARIAIETDFEFFQLFGNSADAIDYVGDLVAYSSTIYEAEVNTNLEVSYLQLWTTSSDPWTQTSCNGVLDQFRLYWIQNNTAIDRTVAHMLSGKATGCGIAYLGVLCNESYGFGVSGNLAGNFDLQNPGVVWDIVVLSHEIGHNFNSPHTHCYNGLGGNSQPVDKCYGGEAACYSGPTQLPCVEGAGNGCGTIMSYCHLLNGGLGNIALSFGQDFPHGTAAERVPSRMHDHVVAQAATYPGCLEQVLTPTPTHTPSITATNIGGLTSTPSITSTATPTPTRTGTATVTPTDAVIATLQQEITPPISTYDSGASVALSANGNLALVGVNHKTVNCDQQGAVFVYARSGSTWTQQAQITADDGVGGDNFGYSVALSNLGDTAVIGAHRKTVGGTSAQGVVYVYRNIFGSWLKSGEFSPSNGEAYGAFGVAVAVSGDGNTVLVGAQGHAYVFKLIDSTWVQDAELISQDAGPADAFGTTVALSKDGTTALIGAAQTDVGATSNQGAAYIFTSDGSTWTQQARLSASDPAAYDYFGAAVALDGSGSTALIGAIFKTVDAKAEQGAAYVFTRNGTTWTEQAKVVSTDGESSDYFGAAVSLSGDGNTGVIGAAYKNGARGAAYLFTRNVSGWTEQVAVSAADGNTFDIFGSSVALSEDATTFLVGAPYNTAAYAYAVTRPGIPTVTPTSTPTRTFTVTSTMVGAATTTPTRSRTPTQTRTATHTAIASQEAELLAADGAANDLFGDGVAVNGDGNVAVVGASGKTINGKASQGAAYVWLRDGSSWTQQVELIAGDGEAADFFGYAVAVSSDASTILVGAKAKTVAGMTTRGAAYVFVRDGASWSQQATLYAPDGEVDDFFGFSVALSGDGNTAIIGAPFKQATSGGRVGMAYVFARSGTSWAVQGEFNAAPSSAYFGTAVALSSDGNTVLAAARGNFVSAYSGAVYVFTRNASTWSPQTALTASDAEDSDTFGKDVAISGDGATAVIGAYGKRIGSYSAQGAAYVFERSGATWAQQAQLIASNGLPSDFFGGAVGVSGDGTTVLVGAYNCSVSDICLRGAAYVYVRNGATWIEAQLLTASDGAANDRLAQRAQLSSDASTAVLGAANKTINGQLKRGAAYVFRLNAPMPVPTASNTPTPTRTDTPLGFPTVTPTITPTPSATRTATPTPTQTPISSAQKLIGSDGDELDAFGYAVALSADGATALVGAYEKAIGANANQGAAYVFVLNGSTWSQQTEFIASDGAADHNFGWAVALSDDGNTALVGAPPKFPGGCVYVYVRNGTTWTQQAILLASNRVSGDNFGYSVDLSSDGNTALVGAYSKTVASNAGQGAAYAFTRNGTAWTQEQQLVALDGAASDNFGRDVALSSDGARALIGAFHKANGSNTSQGAAYSFTRSGMAWTQEAKLIGSDGGSNDFFGRSVALSTDGVTAMVGANGKMVGGNSTQGAAYVYLRSGSAWSEQAKLLHGDATAFDSFGVSVALGNDGNTALIGAYSKKIGNNSLQGQAYLFGRNQMIWTQQAKVAASDGTATDRFGWAVDLNSAATRAIVAAYNKAINGQSGQGAVYIYDLDNSTPPPTTPVIGTPTSTFTASVTSTRTNTPTRTATRTASATRTSTRSATPTPTSTHTVSSTATRSPTSTPTNTPTRTATSTPTRTPTNTPTSSPTNTLTSSPTDTPTSTPTNTLTSSPTDTPTSTPSESATATPTPTMTATFTASMTATSSATMTATNTPTGTTTALPTFSATPTATAVHTSTPTPTATAVIDTPTHTPTPAGFGLCEPAPRTDCFMPGKSKILVIDRAQGERDKLDWKWIAGAAIPIDALGDPRVDASYSLCFYSADALVYEANIPPAGSCVGRPCWKATGSGFKYRDNDRSRLGINDLLLKAASAGRSQLKVKGSGASLYDPSPFALPVTLQLSNTRGYCWSSSFVAPATILTAEELKDREP